MPPEDRVVVLLLKGDFDFASREFLDGAGSRGDDEDYAARRGRHADGPPDDLFADEFLDCRKVCLLLELAPIQVRESSPALHGTLLDGERIGAALPGTIFGHVPTAMSGLVTNRPYYTLNNAAMPRQNCFEWRFLRN